MSLRYLNIDGEVQIFDDPGGRCRLLSENLAEIDGRRQPFAAWQTRQEIQVWWQGQIYVVPLPGTSRRSRGPGAAGSGGLQLVSQMPGTILNVLATVGQTVEAGQPLVLMESMKMEMSLESPSAGQIAEYSAPRAPELIGEACSFASRLWKLKMYPAQARIVEVGPRDGLQNEKEFVPTSAKLEFIRGLSQAGLQEVEIGSFVHPKWVPQLADAEEVTRTSLAWDLLSPVYTVLVPNLKGLERALECGVRRIAIFTAASETFSQRNTNRSVPQSLQEFVPMLEACRTAGVSVRGYISTVFVCPYEGDIAPEKSLAVAEALLAMGVDEVSLGDTVGRAAPREVEVLLKLLLSKLPACQLALHFHDTAGTALANVLIGLQMGITTFDSSAGGLGGCPYAPGASGNLATEDLVYMLERMGIATGVSLAKLQEVSGQMAAVLGKSPVAHHKSV